jgi:HEAT repeat protein
VRFRPALPRNLAACLRDAKDPRPATRVAALVDLVKHQADQRTAVITCLEEALRDEAAAVRAAAAVGLADVGARESLAALLFAVEDQDGHVRQMALTAVGELGDPRARERLRRALSDARPEVRFQAVIAFARVAEDEALDAALQAFADEDANVRYVAVRCAEEVTLGKRRSVPEPIVQQLQALLSDPAPAVRIVAAVVLARAGYRAGVPILAEVACGRLRTPEAEDEAAAVELSGELDLRETVHGLARRAFGVLRWRADPFAWQALVALARMGDARAERKIMGDLRSRDRDRRTMAVAAVGRAKLASLQALVLAMQGQPALADPNAVALTLEQLNGRDPFDVPEVSF